MADKTHPSMPGARRAFAFLGAAQGTTNTERVDLQENLGTVVLQVYGYNGAQGPYGVTYECRTQ